MNWHRCPNRREAVHTNDTARIHCIHTAWMHVHVVCTPSRLVARDRIAVSSPTRRATDDLGS